jgi:pimeloyl-ACP methyl ester carboxylesterase
MTFEIPAPSLTFDAGLDDGAKIAVRRHGFPGGLRLFISHGSGFAADAYFPFWRQLLPRFDLMVFDFRNHGRNEPAVPPHHTYEQLALDLERVVTEVRSRLGDKPTLGLFHSMSGLTAMKHAVEIGWRWDALILFDPPNVPPVGHPNHAAMRARAGAFEKLLTAWARRRRRSFAAIAELAQEYRQSRATARWVEGAHELMAQSVLRRTPDGDGYQLVCDPDNEAAIYAEAMTLNLWPPARAFGGPVKLVGSDPNLAASGAIGPANQALAAEGGYDYSFIAGAGHLLQIEKPDECMRLTLAFLAKHGLA